MNAITSVISQFTTFYAAEQYDSAYDYLTQQQAQHPIYRVAFLAWRAAMASRSGSTAQALELLEEIVQAGGWLHEGALQRDPDYAALQDDPRMPPLIAACADRRAQAKATVRPERIVLEPEGFAGARPLLLALHGNLENASLVVEHWRPMVDAGWRVAVLQSSQLFWLNGFYVWDNHEIALPEVQRHYRELCEQLAVDTDKVVIAGFSSGGGVAAHAALSGAVPACGFLALESFSTAWDDPELWAEWIARPYDHFRAVLQVGQLDAPALEGTHLFADLLTRHNLAHRVIYTANTYHTVPDNFPELLPGIMEHLIGQDH